MSGGADHAVLTGDVIGSQALERATLDGLFDRLDAIADQISRWQGTDTRLTRFRGDGWQMVLTQPGLALRSAALIRAALRRADRRHDSRIAIGIGPIETLPAGPLGEASGAAFVISGRLLDTLPKGRAFDLAGGPDAARAAVLLADMASAGWTAAQSAAAQLALVPTPPTQRRMAETLEISEQAVSKTLASLGSDGWQAAFAAFEAHFAPSDLTKNG